MGRPVGFEGANCLLLAPPGYDECSDLPIYRSEGQVISCWRLTEDELKRVNETGVVWFTSFGQTHPPINISGDDGLFVHGRPSKAEPYIPPPAKEAKD